MNLRRIQKAVACFLCLLIFNNNAKSQKTLFQYFPFDSIGVKLYELYTTKEGVTWITSSAGLWGLKGRQFDGPAIGTGVMYDEKGKRIYPNIKMRNYTAEDSIRSIAQGSDSIVYFVAHDNFFLFRPNGVYGGWGWPPFIFPKTSPITKIWIDDNKDLFAGTEKDNFYFIKGAANKEAWIGIEMGPDKDSNYTVKKTSVTIRQIILQPGAGVLCFAQDAEDKNLIWIGTNKGLFTWNKKDEKVTMVDLQQSDNTTVTEVYTKEKGHIWFSTLEKGMGVYSPDYKTAQFYPYPKREIAASTKYPIKTFCIKSSNQFFVAVMDSFPAIFNTESRNYLFINDSAFQKSPNRTNDIKVDTRGNLVVIKGGGFFIADVSKNDILKTGVIRDSSSMAPFFRSVDLENGKQLANMDYNPELLKKLILKYNQNSFLVKYDVNDFVDREDIHFAWKVDKYSNEWINGYSFNVDSVNFIPFQDLKPGKYVLQLKVRIGKEPWRKQIAEMTIIITPPFWKTWWFWGSLIVAISILIYLIVKLRVRSVRKQERRKAAHEKELLALEAKALRAQMNPHFIFNCLNSIKSLIQQDEKEKSVTYLTTFSKLIRNLFNSADKKEISLHDEIETCKLYLQLEAMRFDTKFFFEVNANKDIDLKSIEVPALIIQPFIENAIWHGIVPRHTGGYVKLNVEKKNGGIEIVIDDDGIGREASAQNKSASGLTHQSKGVNLTQSRLELNNLLQQRHATLEVIDKKDETGIATGTKVIIKIKEEI